MTIKDDFLSDAKDIFDVDAIAVEAIYKPNKGSPVETLCVPNEGQIGIIDREAISSRDFVARISIPRSTYNLVGSIETDERIFIKSTGFEWRVLSVDSINDLRVVLNCVRKNIYKVKA